MSDTLTVSLVQYAPHWEDVQSNLSRLDVLFRSLAGKTDLIILPEMFSTGFSMNTGRTCNGENSAAVLQWMQQQAQSTGAAVTGSIAAAEGVRCYNRLYWVNPDGVAERYDKRHLFTMSAEPQYFTAGAEQKQFSWRGWQIKPIICYDLRFPEWCRNNRIRPYDLLICPASWPATRSDVWLTLLKARALENQCYVAGVNRVGTDGNGLQHRGDSVIYGPKGEIAGQVPENEAAAVSFDLSLSALRNFRQKFPVLNDMDEFFF
ncbi:MAG: amidohydrolase [Bacteroidales bacterium]|jgi:predicted amidohydrolase|nr:amidohydrolase [Bacteroidales bacterium]